MLFVYSASKDLIHPCHSTRRPKKSYR